MWGALGSVALDFRTAYTSATGKGERPEWAQSSRTFSSEAGTEIDTFVQRSIHAGAATYLSAGARLSEN